ncbi:MAG: CheY-like chemotaxis protein/signal transduction histidine kinase [Candidatus Endobugula sp.]|jgi:CheY-like chemotaxis protein/signal transduction histidine kinase
MFTATSKVHLQRNVMRETDMRLVAYSQKGIFLSVLAFGLTVWVGDHHIHNPTVTAILSIGLVTITLVRGYFLFRFESIYPKGPGKWRNIFFFLTFIGSAWWGTLVATMTWVGGLNNEIPILWLYTVGFFAGSLYVIGPFKEFLRIYMAVAFVPCSVTAFLLFDPVSALYGVIMMMLYVLLYRQGEVIGDNYWDKLQATYDLLKKTKTLEAEKISTQSTLNESDVIFSKITRELTASMQEISSGLTLLKEADLPIDSARLLMLTEQKNQQQRTLLKNISEMKNITQKNVLLDTDVINLRYHLERSLSNISSMAHQKGIELFPFFSAGFPLKVRGDGERVQQLVSNLISSACQYCDGGNLTIDFTYQQEADTGIFRVSITNNHADKDALPLDVLQRLFSPRDAQDAHIGLSLAVVKGLASCMGGFANVHYKKSGALVFWASAKLPVISMETVEKQTLVAALSDKRVLFYQPPEALADVLSATLHHWGLNVDLVDDEQSALSMLHTASSANGYDLIIIYVPLDDHDSTRFSEDLCQQSVTSETPQILLISQLQSKTELVQKHLHKHSQIQTVYKPIEHRYLQKKIKSLLIESRSTVPRKQVKHDVLSSKTILLFQKEEIDIAIIQKLLGKIGCIVSVAASPDDCLEKLSQHTYHGFICESHLTDINLTSFVNNARMACEAIRKHEYTMPIIGFTNHQLEGEESQCLASGMDCYLNSPIDIEDLRAVLKRFIGRAAYIANIDPSAIS